MHFQAFFGTFTQLSAEKTLLPSLTSVLPELAPSLGLTSQALYERARALIRLELLPSAEGRGRRSGAQAEPAHIALLIIAVMATDNLSEIDGRVRRLAQAKIIGKQRASRCPITDATNFHDALTALLSDKVSVSRDTDTLIEISVSRFEPKAWIEYFAWPGLKEPVHTEFGETDQRRFDVLSVSSELPHGAFLAIKEIASRARESKL
ncbi:hypothetical protein [Bradyrhizobium sp. th.b2]|uniref:hypothetical protein n=1 Tax=Bradyrhizobium sp. th-b2 TaxID=172088 RepID=UPI0012EC73CD|nr:hypothetical protein [Bradyrhizobium sp. th.b2]